MRSGVGDDGRGLGDIGESRTGGGISSRSKPDGTSDGARAAGRGSGGDGGGGDTGTATGNGGGEGETRS